MYKTISTILFIFICNLLSAQTIIDGDVWTKNNSPYHITHNTVVVDLTIEPGVTVLFDNNYSFDVDSILTAGGLFSDSIYFAPDPANSNGWGGISFNPNTSASILKYCRIEGANNQGININASSPSITNCRIFNNTNGINISNSQLDLFNCDILNMSTNGVLLNNAKINLHNSVIANNGNAGIISSNAQDTLNLINSVIADNIGTAVMSVFGQVNIKNSIIYYNGGEIASDPSKTVVMYNCIEDYTGAGTGNITSIPNFITGTNFVLSNQSVCIDKGDDSTIFNDMYFPPSLGGVRNDMGIYGGPFAGLWYPPIVIQPDIINFGNVSYNTSKTVSLNIKNYRDSIITVDSIKFDGINSHVFIANKSNFNIPVLDSAQLLITFTPDQQNIFSANLKLKTQNRGTVNAFVSGEGVVAKINLFLNILDFNTVDIGDSSTLGLRILNSGSDTLKIHQIYSTNPVFSLQDTIMEINPNLSLDTLFVTFLPDSAKNYLDSLILLCNDPVNGRKAVSLLGEGFGPVIGLNQQILDFGSTSLNSDSLLNLTISNIGNDTLLIQNIKIDSIDKAFKLANDALVFPIIVEQYSSYILPIQFTPYKLGGDSAVITIECNDRIRPGQRAQLKGYGITPIIELSSEVIDFDTIPLGAQSTRKLYIYNRGEEPLNIFYDSLKISGPDSNLFFIDNINGDSIVAQEDSITITLRFSAIQTGQKIGYLHIVSNDPRNPTKIIYLNGISTNYSVSINFDQNNSSSKFIMGQNANIGFNITANFAIDSTILTIRQGGKIDSNKILLTKIDQSDLWETQINSNLITERGLEYYVRVFHGQTSMDEPLDGFLNPNIILVEIPKIQFPQKTKKEKYQKISIPFSTKTQTIGDLFEDDLGVYNNENYRFFDCPDGETYTELLNMDTQLPPGKAVWLIAKNEISLDVTDGQSIRTDTTNSLQLRAGWNMIGSPFAFPINWTDVDTLHHLRFYDGSDWPPSSVLEPYKGYAVKVTNDTLISIPPKEADGPIVLPKSNLISGTGWSINVAAKTAQSKDEYNYAGTHKSACAEIDRFDAPEPPPIGDFISLYFLPINQKTNRADRYSTDIRNMGEQGYIYDFEILSNIAGKKSIEIKTTNLPDDFYWIVLSPETNVKYTNEFIFTTSEHSKYKLIVGAEEFIFEASKSYSKIPVVFKLNQNYPNPFNPTTIIKYQLPNRTNVNINVFNILGQRIKSLLKNKHKEAGYFQVKWNGTNYSGKKVSSGIYFLQLSTKEFSKSVKMILQR